MILTVSQFNFLIMPGVQNMQRNKDINRYDNTEQGAVNFKKNLSLFFLEYIPIYLYHLLCLFLYIP